MFVGQNHGITELVSIQCVTCHETSLTVTVDQLSGCHCRFKLAHYWYELI